MRILGELCLQAAFVSAGYGAVVGFATRHDDSRRWHRQVALASALCLGALLAVTGILCYALLTNDFGFDYVAHYTSRLLPWSFRLSALWVGQAGSLLLWTCLTAGCTFVFQTVAPAGLLKRTATSVLLANVMFLLAVMVFAADPMKASLAIRRDGLGLSPLLQHPSMLVHPPVVFLAYAVWTVPFALAAATLLSRPLDGGWIRLARPWAVVGWVVLGAGLLLGAHWAYQELGWGGYWGWDPVENGSFLPWLTGTGLVHALMAWRSRGVLKKLALTLAILTFALCNFATFLTRSGIFSSVHAFSQSPIGWMFLGLMALFLVGGSGLLWSRRRELGPDHPLGGPWARESLILASAYLLLMLTAVVTVGTLFVPLSTMLLGRTIQIGGEFYNYVFAPIGLAVLAMTSVVPLVRWGEQPRTDQCRALLACGTLAVLSAVGAWAWGLRHPAALTIVSLTVLTLSAIVAQLLLESYRYGWKLMPRRVLLTIRRQRRQYAGFAVHVGLICVAIGIAGSSLGTQRIDSELDEGQVFEWAGRRIEYVRLEQREELDKLVAEVELRVSRGSEAPVVLRPARHLHALQNEWTTEVAIASTWTGDFYTVLNAGLGDGRVHLTLVSNPLLRWLWAGGWIAAGAAGVAVWPQRRRWAPAIVLSIDQHRRPNQPTSRRKAA